MDPRFRVDLIAATPNPQQCVYVGMHQDYSEGFVAADREQWPDETKAGEICVKRLLAGERGHYGPMEHAQIVLNVGWFPHSVMQQARTHRVGVSFDVQSMRYTGDRICRAAAGELDLEEVFYLRPLGQYSNRQGKRYQYSQSERTKICITAKSVLIDTRNYSKRATQKNTHVESSPLIIGSISW
jgi:thymidylate synthase (FAD)